MNYICSKQEKIDKLWGVLLSTSWSWRRQESRWNMSGKAK